MADSWLKSRNLHNDRRLIIRSGRLWLILSIFIDSDYARRWKKHGPQFEDSVIIDAYSRARPVVVDRDNDICADRRGSRKLINETNLN